MTAPSPSWLYAAARNSIPPTAKGTVVEWAVEDVRLPGSARSEAYDPSITPWTVAPTNCAGDGMTRHMTFVKPVQAGGSTCGEVGLCYWLAHANSGDIAYYWPNDVKARDRWDKRVERILRESKTTGAMIRRQEALRRWSVSKGLIIMPRMNLSMLGANSQSNVEGDSYRFEVNEEIHDNENDHGWRPGRLAQAHNRTTAFWNSVIFDISNASKVGDQLHQSFDAGTRQPWEVKCPGCSNPHHRANSVYHIMRTRWEEKRPELGGLRYDAEGCRLEGGRYDYNKMQSTIHLQMPCGYRVHEDARVRKALSLSGRYAAPTNPGAPLSHRSFTLEAVSVDYISFQKLIQEKHEALRARRRGDPEPWRRYINERESVFYDPNDVPTMGRIVLSERKKDRAGLENRTHRFAALDRQMGSMAEGELPHWWHVIRDVTTLPDGRIHTLLVFEGKQVTDEDAVETNNRFELIPQLVAVDSGDDTVHVYRFCLKHGYNAIKGSGDSFFNHPKVGQRIYSVEKPLHTMINQPACFDYIQVDGKWIPDPREPMFWHYSKAGIRDRLAWLRSSPEVVYETPGDVSEDYKNHNEAEEQRTKKHPTTGETITYWVQLKDRNDLYVCEAYIAVEMEMAGLIGNEIT